MEKELNGNERRRREFEKKYPQWEIGRIAFAAIALTGVMLAAWFYSH